MPKVLIAFLVILAFAGGWTADNAVRRHLASEAAEDRRLLDSGGARAPLWTQTKPCRAPTVEERAQDRTALEVLRNFRGRPVASLGWGAVEHFSQPWRRARTDPLDRHAPKPCLEAELQQAVAEAAVRGGVFDSPWLFEPPIALAQQVGPTHPQIVESIARTAFAADPIPSDGLRTDLRPYARLVLAEFGPAARPFGRQAFAQISALDSMGTGAAQVAVAAGQPGALGRVRQLMTDLLAQTPPDKPIPLLGRNRLYELAFALGMAGPAAEPYAGPLVQLLDRKVQSLAPPFGIVELPPTQMCAVATHIGGASAAAAARRPFCQGEQQSLEQ